jgi:5-methylcytosine-specific restriction endonuclease McrA
MDTLVLSALYEPLASVGWRPAMGLWLGGRVEVVESYRDRLVRTVREAYPVPAVVRFREAMRRRGPMIRFCRENVYARDQGRCQYCGLRLAKARATFDHVIPRSTGGPTSWDNIVTACIPCNQRKANRTPEEAAMGLLSRPAEPRYGLTLCRLLIQRKGGIPDAWQAYLPDLSRFAA